MSLFDLPGKPAVVTGGTRGIGLMIARGLLELPRQLRPRTATTAAVGDAPGMGPDVVDPSIHEGKQTLGASAGQSV